MCQQYVCGNTVRSEGGVLKGMSAWLRTVGDRLLCHSVVNLAPWACYSSVRSIVSPTWSWAVEQTRRMSLHVKWSDLFLCTAQECFHGSAVTTGCRTERMERFSQPHSASKAKLKWIKPTTKSNVLAAAVLTSTLCTVKLTTSGSIKNSAESRMWWKHTTYLYFLSHPSVFNICKFRQYLNSH